jgi:hypothetical protein
LLCVGIVMGGGEADLPSHPTVGMQGCVVGGGGAVVTKYLTPYLTVNLLRSHHTVPVVHKTLFSRWRIGSRGNC